MKPAITSFCRVLASCGTVALSVGVLVKPPTVYAQQPPLMPPPSPPITGTVAIEGTVQKAAAGADLVVIKTAHGLGRLFHVTERTVVHAAKDGGDSALDGLKEGSEVVVHSTNDAGPDTAVEIDRIGSDGLDASQGVVTRLDREGKKLTIRLADGSIQTFRLSERAARDAGKDVDQAAAGTARVAVYYTDEAGDKVVHFFKRIS